MSIYNYIYHVNKKNIFMKKYLFPFLLLQSLTTIAQKPEMVYVEGGSFTMGCTILFNNLFC